MIKLHLLNVTVAHLLLSPAPKATAQERTENPTYVTSAEEVNSKAAYGDTSFNMFL